MPRVPLKDGPSVLPGAAPSLIQRTQATPDAFGAQIGRAGERGAVAVQRAGNALVGTGLTGLAIATEQLDKENDTTFNKEMLEYDRKTKILLHGDGTENNPGYYGLKGQAAVDALKKTSEEMDKARGEILARYGDSELRERLTTAIGSRSNKFAAGMSRHFTGQHDEMQDTLSDARKGEFLDEATVNFRDPATIRETREKLDLTIERDGQRKGWTPETVASQKEKAHTTMHSGVIDRYLADKDVSGARAYFAATKDDIDGRQHSKILRAIRTEADKEDTVLRDGVNDAVDVLEVGKIPPDLLLLRERVKGTKHEKRLNEAVADREAVDEFTHKPMPQQQAELSEFAAKTDATPDEVRQMQRKQKVFNRAANAINQGKGLDVAASLGFINQPVEVDYKDPGTLIERRRQSEIASARMGVHVSPLSDDDIDRLGKRLDGANEATAERLLTTLHSGFGYDLAVSIANEAANNKKPELSIAILRAADNPKVASAIVTGARMRREQGNNLQLTASDKRDAIASELGDMFQNAGTTGPIAEIVASADALYAARRVPTGDLTFDGEAYAQALRDAAGGIVNYNGRPTIPPHPSFDEDDMEEIVNTVTEADLTGRSFGGGAPVTSSGQEFGLDMFTGTGLFGRNPGQLVAIGPGIYRVLINGRLVMDSETKRPYAINLRGITPKTGPRSLPIGS